MLRLCFRTIRRHRYRLSLPLRRRSFCSSSSSSTTSSSSPSSKCHDLDKTTSFLSPLSPTTTTTATSRTKTLSLLAATAIATSTYLIYSSSPTDNHRNDDKLPSAIETAVQRSTDSTHRIIHRMKHTAAAASVLWQSLQSVLSSANYEVRSGFEFRVAAFLADIAAANSARRTAIVAGGGGRVVDWLLETVSRDVSGTQAEAARALAYLIADPLVRPQVFERPHSVPYLLRFIFSSQPQRSKKVKLCLSLSV